MKLPRGWVAVLDEDSGDYFYWNQVADTTQWEIPTEDAYAASAGAAAAAAAASASVEPVVSAAEAEAEDAASAAYAAAGKRKNRQVIMAESYDPSASGKVDIVRVEKPETSKYAARVPMPCVHTPMRAVVITVAGATPPAAPLASVPRFRCCAHVVFLILQGCDPCSIARQCGLLVLIPLSYGAGDGGDGDDGEAHCARRHRHQAG